MIDAGFQIVVEMVKISEHDCYRFPNEFIRLLNFVSRLGRCLEDLKGIAVDGILCCSEILPGCYEKQDLRKGISQERHKSSYCIFLRRVIQELRINRSLTFTDTMNATAHFVILIRISQLSLKHFHKRRAKISILSISVTFCI